MSSNEQTIKCENCRQDILANKMFLHEGFCQRNNVFCEHCERVYLKKDYKEHILEISVNLTKKNRESISKQIETNINNNNHNNNNNNINNNITQKETNINNNNIIQKETNINNINNNIIQKNLKVNNNVIYQQERSNWIEQYSINAPIIIGPNGEIVSKKNKNDFLLPILGIENVRYNNNSNINNNYFPSDDIYFNKNYYYNLNNDIFNYEKFNYFNNGAQMRPLYSTNTVTIPRVIRSNKLNGQNHILTNQNKNNNNIIKKEKNQKTYYNKKNLILNNINNNRNNIYFANKNCYSDKKKIVNNVFNNEEMKSNKNDIQENIIKNKNDFRTKSNILPYNSKNSNNQVNKIINPFENTSPRGSFYDTNTLNTINTLNNLNNTRKSFIISSKYKTTTEFNPVRVSKINRIHKMKKLNTINLDKEMIDNNINNSDMYTKEPLDNLRRSEMKKSFIESKIISQNEVEKNKNNLDNNNISLSITIDNSKMGEKSNNENIIDSSDNEFNNNFIKQLKPSFDTIKIEKKNNFRNIINISPDRAKSEEKIDIKKRLYQTSTNRKSIKRKKYIHYKPKKMKEFKQEKTPNKNNINKRLKIEHVKSNKSSNNVLKSLLSYTEKKEKNAENKENN